MEHLTRVSTSKRQSETAGYALILLGAFISFVLSVSLWFAGNHEQGIYARRLTALLWSSAVATGGNRDG